MFRKLLFFLLLPLLGFGQGEIAHFDSHFKDNMSVGAGLKTNGLRLSYRKGFYYNIYGRKFYEIEFTTIKDPREVKFANPFYVTTENIYFGKVNSCFDLRFGWGALRIIADKGDQGSVEIRILTSAGGSLGFMKPVYYTVVDKTGSYTYDTKFTQDLILQQIIEMAPFYKGLDELKINPGGYAKLGISFEHSKRSLGISSLEVGTTFSAYLLPMQSIYGDRGRNFILNLYIEYRLGKYFDPYNPKRRNKLQQLKDQQ